MRYNRQCYFNDTIPILMSAKTALKNGADWWLIYKTPECKQIENTDIQAASIMFLLADFKIEAVSSSNNNTKGFILKRYEIHTI